MWEYREAAPLETLRSVYATDCIFCMHEMLRLPPQEFESGSKRLLAQLSICMRCGWWSVYRAHQGEHPRTANLFECYSGAVGSLKQLDLTDTSVPLTEVRQYLFAKRDSVFDAHPKLFEDVVCSVFRDLGWHARVTAYSGDDGIDVVLDGPEGKPIGVQVKRYRKARRIEAEQIRSFAGALVLNGHTEGVFVTTSSFRKGAKRTADLLAQRGYPVDLIDADRFFQALCIAQTNVFELSGELYAKYLLSRGEHLGSGPKVPLVEGEDLRHRTVAARLWRTEDFLAIHGDELAASFPET